MTQIGTVLRGSRVLPGLLAALAGVPLLGAAAARASNCAVSHTELLSDTLSPAGALVLVTRCPGEAPGCSGALPEAVVERDGLRVDGSLEVLSTTAAARWLVFRPDRPWQLGNHRVSGLDDPAAHLDFEVRASLPALALEDGDVEFGIAAALAPAGERVCCPSRGEGDCTLVCGGLAGERRVARIEATPPETPASVVWTIEDAGSEDARPVLGTRLDVEDERARYCARLTAWDSADGSTRAFARCFDDFDARAEEVGTVTESWSELALAECSAPPIEGGYGYDVLGARLPDPPPEFDPELLAAYCSARQATCAGSEAAAEACGAREQAGLLVACPCYAYARFCADAAPDASASSALEARPTGEASTGCSLSAGAQQHGDLAWLGLGALAGWIRRRRARVAR